MCYLEKIGWYVEKCQQSVVNVQEVITNDNLDITLTRCEKFDYQFKKEFIAIYNAEQKKSFFKRNNFKGRKHTAFIAQMFYLILTTSDNYNFEVLQKVLKKITGLAYKRKYTTDRVETDVVENENKYLLKVVVVGEEPLSYCIEDKQSYVVCLSNLLTVCAMKSHNKMIAGYYKTYLQHEIMKIESDTEPTPYVEWTKGLHLCDYFEPSVQKKEQKEAEERKARAIPKFVRSDIDLEKYEKIASIANELEQGAKALTSGETPVDRKTREDEFYESTFIRAFGPSK